MSPIRLEDREAVAGLASAGPVRRGRALTELRVPVQERVRAEVGHILDVAPTYHVLPFQPQKGHEERVREILTNAVEWLEERKNVHAVALYRLVSAKDTPESAPMFLLTLFCDNRSVMEELLRDETGQRIASVLREMCTGRTATEAGEFGISSMLLGLV